MESERFDIPPNCRDFNSNHLEDRRTVAIGLLKAFLKHFSPKGYKNKAWTVAVRETLSRICPTSCEANPRDPQSRKGEFLVDYCWHDWANREVGNRLLLVCESEWGTKDRFGEEVCWQEVEVDFEKLLSVKAPFKLLIFTSNFQLDEAQSREDGDFSIEYARKRLSASLECYGHHLAGEVYVFLDFPRKCHEEGVYRLFIWQSQLTAPVAFVDLSPVEDGNYLADRRLQSPDLNDSQLIKGD